MYQLIYKSRSNEDINWDLVNSILASSSKNNPTNGITGVLLATETHFMQVLEGGFAELNSTFERIARDKRHHTLQIISFRQASERLFGQWAMHGIGLFEFNLELVFELSMKYGADNGIVRFPQDYEAAMQLISDVSERQS